MKRSRTIIKATALLCGAMLCIGAGAQEAGSGTDEFKGHWHVGVHGGIGQTIGETSFGSLISPAAGIDFGYRFTPVWGIRAGIGGWQAKGAVVGPTQEYSYNYLQGSIDATVDICSIFAGYKMSRTLNPYLFAGIGVNGAFNNDEAQALSGRFPADNLLWDGSKVLPAGRFGGGLDIRLTNVVHLSIEIDANFLGDSFNSKRGSAVDWQLGAQAGLKFNIGMKKARKSTAAPAAAVPAAVPAVQDQSPAEEPEKEAQPEPVVVPQEPAAAQEPAPAPEETVEKKEFKAVQSDILFTIGRSEIREDEMSKINAVVEDLKADPQTVVKVIGHADAETGSEERNLELSRQRAENVAAAIMGAGISSDRVTVEYKGDKENPYTEPARNRVAICVIDLK